MFNLPEKTHLKRRIRNPDSPGMKVRDAEWLQLYESQINRLVLEYRIKPVGKPSDPGYTGKGLDAVTVWTRGEVVEDRLLRPIEGSSMNHIFFMLRYENKVQVCISGPAGLGERVYYRTPWMRKYDFWFDLNGASPEETYEALLQAVQHYGPEEIARAKKEWSYDFNHLLQGFRKNRAEAEILLNELMRRGGKMSFSEIQDLLGADRFDPEAHCALDAEVINVRMLPDGAVRALYESGFFVLDLKNGFLILDPALDEEIIGR